jgi:hypothetical protein
MVVSSEYKCLPELALPKSRTPAKGAEREQASLPAMLQNYSREMVVSSENSVSAINE